MDYPFTRCESPKFVHNRYTHEPIIVGCGKCRACVTRDADRKAFLCSIEESEHKFCAFVTLTYDNNNIPRFRLVRDGNSIKIKNLCSRNGFDKIDLGYIPENDVSVYTDSYISLLADKCNLDGDFGYTNARDIQLFLKRFRKNLKQYSYEKVRYYAVAEFGPVHFRPHWHLLLFFDEEETFANYRKVIYKSWSFGRVDASISRGKVNSYVSSYVNSRVTLPRLFTLRSLGSVVCHSLFFAKSVYRSKAKEIYANDIKRFMHQCRTIGSKNVSFSPWRSLNNLLFPKCSEYSCKSFSELYYSYNVLSEAKCKYGKEKSITQLVNLIVRDVRADEKNITIDCYGNFDFSKCSNDLQIMYFRKSSCDDDTLPSRVASDLYCSKHFLTFVVPNMYPDEDYNSSWCRYKAVKRIVDFYNSLALDNLASMYKAQNSYYNIYNDVYGYCYFYNNFPLNMFGNEKRQIINDAIQFNLYCKSVFPSYICSFISSIGISFFDFYNSKNSLFSNLDVYKEFYNETFIAFSKRVKHKRLNDLNAIFCI